VVVLPEGQWWFRVADSSWGDPLDPGYAARYGGRWNPPESYPTLYLNEDLATARAQIYQLLEGQPAQLEDLDPPYVLAVATLPGRQRVADTVSPKGVIALGLPAGYPYDNRGRRIGWSVCQRIGKMVFALGMRGVCSRSAATKDGSGRELAWFPATSRSRAKLAGPPVPFDRWWTANEAGALFP
jgi:hypothetical protein